MKDVKTIFIVDDDPMQSMMLKDYLSKYSYLTIHTFQSGEECIKNLTLDPQIIFLDYNFDKVGPMAMNGIDILKEIKSQKPDIEVVMISGQDKIEVAVNTIKYGAFDYVVKSETAFHRSEHIVFNVMRRFKLQAEALLYKRLTWSFGIAFILVMILLCILYKMGKITNDAGWF